MIVYLDTSAFVPLVVLEPATPLCRRLWDEADTVVASRLLYVEAAAAVAQARRTNRWGEEEYARANELLDELWIEIEVAEVDEDVVRRAAHLARRLALRGYDAVHCASAEQLSDPDLVAASGDRPLLGAWRTLGLTTVDTTNEGGPDR